MPPKKRRVSSSTAVQKRQKREHPAVEHWLGLSFVAKSIAANTKQQQQYIALLLQISDLTQHDANVPDNPWSGEHVDFQDVRNYVLSWLDDFDENIQGTTNIRDRALQSLKNADPQSDDELKEAAILLTEAEKNIQKLETFMSRWERIVRYKNVKISLREHTDTWLTRWLREWESTNASKTKNVKQFQETLMFVSRDSQSPVLVQTDVQ